MCRLAALVMERDMKFRKKPVVIEAWRYEVNAALPDYLIGKCLIRYPVLEIDTPEGTMTAQPGDWIIRGVKGEVYPCKPDIFEATYDQVA
jgi:hypothetical protein